MNMQQYKDNHHRYPISPPYTDVISYSWFTCCRRWKLWGLYCTNGLSQL